MEFLEPIHQAALLGDVPEIDRLAAEEPQVLHMRVQAPMELIDGLDVVGCTPLLLAAWKGQVPAVHRLLQLGSHARAKDVVGCSASHWACIGMGDNKAEKAQCLALLLDAGAPLDARMANGSSPIMEAAYHANDGCLRVLLQRSARRARALAAGKYQGKRAPPLIELDAQDADGNTALHSAAAAASEPCVRLLLDAGAHPGLVNNRGERPREASEDTRAFAPGLARLIHAEAEPQRGRLLFKARALVETARTVRSAMASLTERGLPQVLQQHVLGMLAPAFIAQRVGEGRTLPVVRVGEVGEGGGFGVGDTTDDDDEEEEYDIEEYVDSEEEEAEEGAGGDVWFDGPVGGPYYAGTAGYTVGKVGYPTPQACPCRHAPWKRRSAVEKEEEAQGVLRMVLGLEGEGAGGLAPGAFGQLLEMVLPAWDPARKGQPLGKGYL